MVPQVRCTGQISGCERCEALDTQCTYITEKRKRQRNLSNGGVNKHDQQARRQPQSWLLDGTEKPEVDVTPLSDANCYNGTEDCAFTSDVEPWSTMFPGLTPDGASTLDSQSGSATASGTAYVSTRPTSHASPGTDVVFWNDNKLPSTDLPAESILSASDAHHTTRQRPHQDQHHSPAKFQPHAEAHGQVRSQGETQGPAHIREPEEPARGPEQISCKCMKGIVYLINELETTLSNHSYVNDMSDIDNGILPHQRHGLDSALVVHKDAIRYGESMRQCRQCVTRTENRMLLLLLANRLIALCAHMISVYRNLVQAASSKSGKHACELAAVVISMGEYKVESTTESSAVLRVLLAFQLRSLHAFVTPLSSTNQLQGAEFQAVKNRAASLWRGIQQDSALSLP